MTKVNSQSKHSVRPLSSTQEGAPGVAGPQEPSHSVAANEIAAEIEEKCNEDSAARDPKIARRPFRPKKTMVLAHELHHADYRDWYDHCRVGKGVAHQHRTLESDNGETQFSVDYDFTTREGQFELEKCMTNEDKVGASPVLSGCDHRSKAIWAMAVDIKGPTHSAAKWLVGKIDQAGCRGIKIVLQSDQEEPIVALKKAVAVLRQAPAVNKESAVRESQAGGNAERAVRTWAAQARTIRHHLEHRLQHKIPVWSALMTWLVAWAAEVICRYKIQSNVGTSYENVTGHKGLQPIAIFGEHIMF